MIRYLLDNCCWVLSDRYMQNIYMFLTLKFTKFDMEIADALA